MCSPHGIASFTLRRDATRNTEQWLAAVVACSAPIATCGARTSVHGSTRRSTPHLTSNRSVRLAALLSPLYNSPQGHLHRQPIPSTAHDHHHTLCQFISSFDHRATTAATTSICERRRALARAAATSRRRCEPKRMPFRLTASRNVRKPRLNTSHYFALPLCFAPARSEAKRQIHSSSSATTLRRARREGAIDHSSPPFITHLSAAGARTRQQTMQRTLARARRHAACSRATLSRCTHAHTPHAAMRHRAPAPARTRATGTETNLPAPRARKAAIRPPSLQ